MVRIGRDKPTGEPSGKAGKKAAGGKAPGKEAGKPAVKISESAQASSGSALKVAGISAGAGKGAGGKAAAKTPAKGPAGRQTLQITIRKLPDFSRETLVLTRGLGPVAGVDEAGRGPLAGPVVAAAVVLDPARIPQGLDDS